MCLPNTHLAGRGQRGQTQGHGSQAAPRRPRPLQQHLECAAAGSPPLCSAANEALTSTPQCRACRKVAAARLLSHITCSMRTLAPPACPTPGRHNNCNWAPTHPQAPRAAAPRAPPAPRPGSPPPPPQPACCTLRPPLPLTASPRGGTSPAAGPAAPLGAGSWRRRLRRRWRTCRCSGWPTGVLRRCQQPPSALRGRRPPPGT